MSGVDNEIKLLIGSDIAGKLFTGNIKCLKSGPVAMQTRLGWVLMGKIQANEASKGNASLACVSLFLNDRSIENFWKLDIIGIRDPVESKTRTEIHEETMQYFKENLKLDSDGRYEVALPWVMDRTRLPSNKELAEKRLTRTWEKLRGSNQVEIYEEVFDTWLRDKIIEEFTNEEVSRGHYLPHRPVFKESSETTKVRPVFDASARGKDSLSLNDCLEKGPNLIEIIPSLFNRFRKYQIGIISDIEKAFLQIGIREVDRDFLRFLWKDANGGKTKVYRHRRVVFGVNCSPFLLAATLACHLENATDQFADTAKILRESFYVDNCVSSFRDSTEADKFVVESKMLLSSAKFNLRGWQSNYETGLISQTEADGYTCVLGLNWDLETDTLSCKVEAQTEENFTASKRSLLSCTHKLFDPIGFTSPVTLFPKLMLQECWKLKLNWDQNLPDHLEKKFLKWLKEMRLISQIKIPRWMKISSSECEEVSLHTFCDASRYAYATCIFLRVKTNEHVFVKFVQARARVAPVRNITVPRLELLSCLIGARLGSTVVTDLNIPKLKMFFWSDSTTALSWIQRNVRWGTFVWNRVEEIRTLSRGEEWRHIPSALNAADLPSRGCSVEQFLKSQWWEGPQWLLEPESSWPISAVLPDEELVNSEKRKTVFAALSKDSKCDNWYYRYFSTYRKVVRMIAWILRFISNSRKLSAYRADLSFSELEAAEKKLFWLIQRDSFYGSNEEKIKSLRPFTDSQGIIRLKTQVMFREDKNSFKYPILLPAEHPVVHMMIFSKHQELLHAGVSLLMTNLREDFWIIRARKTVHMVIRRCSTCKRFSAKKTESVPISLPADRVQDAAVFEVIGVDLAGPLYLKGGQKAWIVLYTCAVYRAVHLELVTSLSTEAFLQSFRRFIARRGRPTTVYSDNGRNLVGANKMLSNIDWEQIAAKSTVQKINWKFNPPTAAWWGGWWERLIQLIKVILRKVLGRAILSYEELSTILCDCEQVVNSRPLTYVTQEVNDLLPLTPLVFLRENRSSTVFDIDTVDKQGLNKRLKYVQRLREHLRKRFRIEYLGQLKQHTVKSKKIKTLSVGDVVIVESDRKRALWTLARVLELIPGKDGLPRVARIKTENGELIRPIQKLYNLEVEGDVTPKTVI